MSTWMPADVAASFEAQARAVNGIASAALRRLASRLAALYPRFQEYFRTHKPPFLAVWGKNDPFFLPPGAEAFKRDDPDATVTFLDIGHFALETHVSEIAQAIRDFFQ